MNYHRIAWLLIALPLYGCRVGHQNTIANQEAMEELFVPMPRSLPSDCSPAVRDALIQYIESAPPGTPLNFFLADNQELLGSTTIPAGSRAYRRKVVHQELTKVFERLDPEKTGGSQTVDLLSVPASVRKYRKRNDLPPRVVVIGSTMVEDREQGNSITNETLPCDGCVTDPASSYGKMPNFPKGTMVSWLTPRADYGNGPNHRGQVEHFLRYLLQEKQGRLVRLTSDATVVFTSTHSQWDGEVTPADTCNGAKEVVEDAPVTSLYKNDGKTEVVALTPTLSVTVRQPEVEHLKGNHHRVLFLVDISGSVIEDADGNDQSQVFKSILADVCKKLETMPFQQFAICAFGGHHDLSPRLPRYPTNLLGGIVWTEATPESRAAGINFVKSLVPGGGTPTHAALSEALKLEGPQMCLLYTDGVPTLGNGGQAAVLQLAEQLADAKVTVQAVGVGALSVGNEEFDWTGGEFLAELARKTGGDYFVLE